jgi:autonomous glycyl radical cofactor GrcA
MRIWGPVRFNPNVIDRETLNDAVSAMSEKWRSRHTTKRLK